MLSAHLCIICGREFHPCDAETVICPNCGGSPETSASSQLQATVLINGSQDTVRVNRQASAMPEEWQEGDVILDLYEVKGEVGRGGLAVVYHVHHRQWNLDLAVKRLRPELRQESYALEAFTRQARAWLDLGLHPHIVTCYYVRRVGDVPCMFTEYIDGGSLKNWIEDGRLYAGDEREALKRILDVAIQLAWGLGHVHEKGFVHQDVKPANALMTSNGTLKLASFGMLGAKRGGYTPAYAAPEQELGQAVSPRTDIWCWGVSVLEMFTGEAYWLVGSVAATVLENYLQETPQEGLPPMPAALADLLRQCFQIDPEQRPTSMDEVAGRLIRIYEQEAGAPYPRQKPSALELRADSLNNKAVSLLDLGLEEEAVRCWQEALRADPTHLEANFNYGYYNWQKAELLGSEFLKQLQGLEATHGSDPEYWRLLGWVYLEQGYVEEVEEILEKRSVEDEAMRRAHRDPNRPVGREVRRFEGHTDRVTSVAFSLDGRYILSGSDDTTVRLWAMKTGKQRRRFRVNTQAVTAVAFSPTGHYVASASGKGGTIRLWRMFFDNDLVRTFRAHYWLVSSVTFSPDGYYLLSGGADNQASLWSITTGNHIRSFVGHKSWVSSVAFSPDGGYVVTGSWDGTVRLWDAATGAELKRFDLNAWRVYSVAFSPDGRYILIGSDNPYFSEPKPLRLWDIENDQKTLFKGLRFGVNTVAFSPDGRCALSGSEDGLRLWEIPTGREIRCLAGHQRSVNAVVFSPDGRYAISGGDDKTVRLWEVHYPTFRPTAGHPYPALSPVDASETVSVATVRQSQPTVFYDTATDLTDTIPVQTVSIETQWWSSEEEATPRYTCFECREDVTEMANHDGRAAGLGDVALYLCANCGRKAREEFKGQPEQIAGYWVLEKLREGGATEVFKGWHPQTGRIVAIEKILSRFSNESSVVYRFQRASAIMENILHPNVVRLYESCIVDSVPVLISEFVPDGDLSQFIGEEGQSLLSPEEIVSLIAESLVGLEYFHQRGYVHRDLKPESILLAEKDGQRIPKIANFFFARGFRKDTDTFFTITRTGEYAGTYMYMPPEQITDFKGAKPPLDVYAMGATTYVLLSGWWPLPDFPSFPAVRSSRGVILKRSIPQMILHDRRVPLEERRPDLPRALCRVVNKAIAKEARDRYQSAEEFRQELLKAL